MAAKSKSPAELKAEGEELKALFAKVKKKSHNCAVLLAKDGIIIEAHIKKSPDILFKAAKKKGGMAKGAIGTMTMDGQVVIIDPINEKIPGNLTKAAKKFFAARGLKYRLEVLEPGQGREDGGQAAGEPPQAGTPAEGGMADKGGDDRRQALESSLARMQKGIDALQADPENVMHPALQDALSAFQRAMDREDHDQAADALETLKGVLKDYQALMAQKRPLVARMKSMARAAEQVKNGDNREAADQIARAMREFAHALGNNEWINAGDKLDTIEALIKEQGSAGDPQAGQGPSAEDLQSGFARLTPGIRQVAANADPALKKKLAMLVKGFKTEIGKSDLGKCQKILTALEQIVGNAPAAKAGAGGQQPAPESEQEKARGRVEQIDSEIGDIEAEMNALEAALNNMMEAAQ